MIQQEDLPSLHLGAKINSIDWLPVKKSAGESRNREEYFGENNNGNILIGCENNGIYLFSLRL